MRVGESRVTLLKRTPSLQPEAEAGPNDPDPGQRGGRPTASTSTRPRTSPTRLARSTGAVPAARPFVSGPRQTPPRSLPTRPATSTSSASAECARKPWLLLPRTRSLCRCQRRQAKESSQCRMRMTTQPACIINLSQHSYQYMRPPSCPVQDPTSELYAFRLSFDVFVEAKTVVAVMVSAQNWWMKGS